MFSYAAKVDVGVFEDHNDDRVLVGSHILTNGSFSEKTDHPYLVAAICDGVGGMAQGDRAAMTGLEVMSHLDKPGVTKEEIQEAIELANRRVRNLQSLENLQNGLRTTIAGIYADKDRFYVYNAGDSRVYRFRGRFFTRLSKDHSLVQDRIDMGMLTPEEAKVHPQKNIINKCIGNEEVVNPRIKDLSEDFCYKDILMICSDGISDEVEDAEFREIIASHAEEEDLAGCCECIYQKAVERGSRDNMSIILIRKEDKESERGENTDNAADGWRPDTDDAANRWESHTNNATEWG
ncbi:MAG: serine/threonine-protein phosphatase [Lachnospiraceae bacterium]|nr:serine/threonine-protein phosphatase [Lachnospiraceae bacterium]